MGSGRSEAESSADMASGVHAIRKTVPEFGREPLPSLLCNLDRLFATMEERGLDGIVSYYAPNVFYLSGYATSVSVMAHEANAFVAVVLSRHEPDHPIAIIPDFEINFFAHQPSWVRDIRPYASQMLSLAVAVEPAALDRFISPAARDCSWLEPARQMYAEGLVSVCAQAMRDVGLDKGRVGFDNYPFAGRLASHHPDIEIKDAYGTLKYVRQAKTPEEVRLLRTAVLLNQTAIERTVAAWETGMSWHELNIQYYAEVLRLGGFVHHRGSLVIANPREDEVAAYMASTGLEDDFVLERGINLMFDCHGTLNRYVWDGGKTWIIDDEPRGLRDRISKACGAATDEIFYAMRPGKRVSELDAVGRRALKKHQVPAADDVFLFFHGVGLENIERESAEREDWAMEDGMVVSIHVIYPGDCQHRWYIEEVAAVTPQGADRFYTWGNDPLTNG